MTSFNPEYYQQYLDDFFEQYIERLLAQVRQVSTLNFALLVLTICILPIIVLIFAEIEAARVRSEQPRGCRKLGLKIESNLSNEFDKKFSLGRPPSTEQTSAEWWRVKSLWIYPVKSCKGVELNRSTVLSTGMEYDRQFTFAQLRSPFPVGETTPDKEKGAHKWQFITQQQYPLLANVRTEIWVPDQTVKGYSPETDDVESCGVVVLSFPYRPIGWRGKLAQWGAAIKGCVPERNFRIPFDPTLAQIEKAGYTYEDMIIWKDTVRALNMELEVPEELRYYLGVSNKLSLFRIDNKALREVHRCAPRKEELGWQPVTAFQDAYPLHLLNLASVRDVERRIPKVKGLSRLSASRFRANIIITGPEAYTEDTWKLIKIGYYEYAVSCRTSRCKLPNVDQTTGERHPTEPDRTLRSFRNVDAGAGDLVGCLGMQMVPIEQESTIRVGDELTVLATGEHFYLKQ